MSDELAEFRVTYITECFELLEEMEAKLLALDAQAVDPEDLNAIFRCAHSIKGGAGLFGLSAIASFTHTLETLLDEMREQTVAVSGEGIDALLKAQDVVYQMVLAAKDHTELADDFGSDIAAQLNALCNNKADEAQAETQSAPVQNSDDKPQCYHIKFAPHPDMTAHGNEPLLLIEELAGLGTLSITCDSSKLPAFDGLQADQCYLSWRIELTSTEPEERIQEVFEFVEDECELSIEIPQAEEDVKTPTAPTSKTANAPAKTTAAPTPQTTSIRVDLDKVDTLINMVGEVVITQAFLSSQIAQLPPQEHTALIRSIGDMAQHIRELQDAVMAVRMQPVKSIFSRMPRLVRDLSGKLQKNITLVTSGEETEVDKTIIEQLSDPLTHMIRNCVDHGIEMPEERIAAGKPAQGTVQLCAQHRGGCIIIEISDDGGGINREKVLAKAIEKGVVSQQDALSESEIDMLIFAPGFSTAQQVSDISGRGVGMDVVRRNIEQIGGSVKIENRPGEGSTFSISLPLTLAILDGMIVRCGQEYYVIPINHIIETLRPKCGDVKPVADGQKVLNIRGTFIPILFLHELLAIDNAQSDPAKALVILLENGTQQIGLVVDELIEQKQIVIKSLEDNADKVAGISGATILGDGNVSLILDIAALHLLSNQRRPTMAHATENTNEYFAA